MKGWSKSKSGVQSDHTAAVQSPRENNYMKSDTAHLSTAVVPEGQLHYKLISLYVVIFFFFLRKLTTILKLLHPLCQQTCPIESCGASNQGLFTFRKNVSHCKVPPYQHIAKNCLALKWHVRALTKMLPRINFTQINSQNLCWSREFFFWSESLASTVRQTWRFHSCKTYKHAFCRRQGCVNRTWSSSMRDEHLFKMKKKKKLNPELRSDIVSRRTEWCRQEMMTSQGRMSGIAVCLMENGIGMQIEEGILL